MRVNVLNGPGAPVALFGMRAGQTRGTALVNGERTVGALPLIVTQAIAWISTHAAQLGPIVQQLFHIGPGYDASNGGEVARQLGPEGTNTLHLKRTQSFVDWIKKNRPDVWQNGKIWERDGADNRDWNDLYIPLVAAGMPDGTLLDANYSPVGLPQVQQAVQAANAVQAEPRPPSATQLLQLNGWALDLCGVNGPAAKANAEVYVRQLKASWQRYVYSMRDIWLASNAVDTGGGNPFRPNDGGGTDTGGGGGNGGNGGGGTDGGSEGNTGLLVAAAVAAKLFGLL
jgi:uncharacterized membrane protein YgcG